MSQTTSWDSSRKLLAARTLTTELWLLRLRRQMLSCFPAARTTKPRLSTLSLRLLHTIDTHILSFIALIYVTAHIGVQVMRHVHLKFLYNSNGSGFSTGVCKWLYLFGCLGIDGTGCYIYVHYLSFTNALDQSTAMSAVALHLGRRVTFERFSDRRFSFHFSSIITYHVRYLGSRLLTSWTVGPTRLLPHKPPAPCHGRSSPPSRRTPSKATYSCSTASATSWPRGTPRSLSCRVVTL